MATLHYPFSEAQTVEFFRTHFGPAQRTFATLAEATQAELRRDLQDFYRRHNRATDGTTRIEAEYLDAVAVRA